MDQATQQALARLGSLVRQLQGVAPLERGVVTATWPGGQAFVDVAISHGLGRVPTGAFAQAQSAVGTSDHWTAILSTTESVINARVRTTGFSPTAGTTTGVAWEAW